MSNSLAKHPLPVLLESGNKASSRGSLQELTNITNHPECQVSGLHTVSSAVRLRVRRELRYSRAQAALASSLRSCASELSPRELQIRALEKATGFLVSRAQEARERAIELRKRLADPELVIDARSYEELQKERWMEEHRLSLADTEEKVLRERLATLTGSMSGKQHGRGSKESKKEPKEDQRVFDEAFNRRHANLARFLQGSSTKHALHRREWRPFSLDDRRVTLSDVSTLRLRPSPISTTTPFSSHGRSKSLTQTGGSSQDVATGPSLVETQPVPTRLSLQSPLKTVTESEERTSTPSMASTISAGRSDGYPQTIPEEPASPDELFMEHGAVSIFSPAGPRSRVEILQELGDVQVPDYAKNLIDEFDHDVKTPSLTLKDPRPHSWASTMVDHIANEEAADVLAPIDESLTATPRRKTRVQSIFSLNLASAGARRISGHFGLHSSTSISSSVRTTDSHDASPTRSHNRSSIVPSLSPSFHTPKRGGLRSTRNWDLAQLDDAPDDIQVVSLEPLPPGSTVRRRPPPSPSASTRGVVGRVRKRLSLLSLR